MKKLLFLALSIFYPASLVFGMNYPQANPHYLQEQPPVSMVLVQTSQGLQWQAMKQVTVPMTLLVPVDQTYSYQAHTVHQQTSPLDHVYAYIFSLAQQDRPHNQFSHHELTKTIQDLIANYGVQIFFTQDTYGNTPLHFAMNNNNLSLLKTVFNHLLPEQKQSVLNLLNAETETIVHIAIQQLFRFCSTHSKQAQYLVNFLSFHVLPCIDIHQYWFTDCTSPQKEILNASAFFEANLEQFQICAPLKKFFLLEQNGVLANLPVDITKLQTQEDAALAFSSSSNQQKIEITSDEITEQVTQLSITTDDTASSISSKSTPTHINDTNTDSISTPSGQQQTFSSEQNKKPLQGKKNKPTTQSKKPVSKVISSANKTIKKEDLSSPRGRKKTQELTDAEWETYIQQSDLDDIREQIDHSTKKASKALKIEPLIQQAVITQPVITVTPEQEAFDALKNKNLQQLQNIFRKNKKIIAQALTWRNEAGESLLYAALALHFIKAAEWLVQQNSAFITQVNTDQTTPFTFFLTHQEMQSLFLDWNINGYFIPKGLSAKACQALEEEIKTKAIKAGLLSPPQAATTAIKETKKQSRRLKPQEIITADEGEKFNASFVRYVALKDAIIKANDFKDQKLLAWDEEYKHYTITLPICCGIQNLTQAPPFLYCGALLEAIFVKNLTAVDYFLNKIPENVTISQAVIGNMPFFIYVLKNFLSASNSFSQEDEDYLKNLLLILSSHNGFDINDADKEGYTPLHIVAKVLPHYTLLTTMVDFRAKHNAALNGKTPLDLALDSTAKITNAEEKQRASVVINMLATLAIPAT
ncbi:hypothetical protein FJ364_04325 [Candidatus Dependentiae bacterium]|nr:hypothetical protein [Candidatus Dependentiae bacterium]